MTAVEWFAKQVLEYKSPTNINGTDYILIPTNKIEFLQEQAKEMEKEQKIEFACKVDEVSAEKYIQGKTTEQIAEELIKQQ